MQGQSQLAGLLAGVALEFFEDAEPAEVAGEVTDPEQLLDLGASLDTDS